MEHDASCASRPVHKARSCRSGLVFLLLLLLLLMMLFCGGRLARRLLEGTERPFEAEYFHLPQGADDFASA